MADLALANSTYSVGTNDTASTLVNNVTATDAQQYNGVASGVVGIETILGTGTTLKGNKADLVARLATCMDADGVLKLSTDSAVTGPLSTAKGGTGKAYDTTPPGVIHPYPMRIAPTGFLICNGAAVSRSTYADLFAVLHLSATVTITIASPGVVTWTAHNMQNGDKVVFTTTGALPTGLTAGTTYYVVNKATDTFQVSATLGGAAINTSGSQSGVHTGINAPYGRGDGSTTFNVPDFRGYVLLGVENLEGSLGGRITSASTNGANAVGMGNTGGAERHTLVESELAGHTHDEMGLNASSPITPVNAKRALADTSNTASVTTINLAVHPVQVNTTDTLVNLQTGSSGGGSGHSNVQPWVTVNYIIKY